MKIRILVPCVLTTLLAAHALGQPQVMIDAHIECWKDASGGVTYEAGGSALAMGLTQAQLGWRFSISGDVIAFGKSGGSGLSVRGFPCGSSDIVSQNDVDSGQVSLSCNIGGIDAMCGETLRYRNEAILKDPQEPLSLATRDGKVADCCPACSPDPGGDGHVPPWDDFSPRKP